MNKQLNLEWVTNVIGEDYKKWEPGDVVTIQAQTGTGKTHFIKKVLIPQMEDWEQMLIVANRINLKRQLKKDLLKYYNLEIPKTLKEIDELTHIGNITILSYQSISEIKNACNYKEKQLNLDKYDYIILDECHFFLSDAAFNNKCLLAYKELVKNRHHNAIKIFISATLEEVEYSIGAAVEKQIDFGIISKKLYKYSTGVDYSYLDTYYFKNLKDISTAIKNNKTGDKWLIFVTKKEDAKLISKYLKGYKTTSVITKDTNTTNKDLQEIINNSKFLCDVLICTKALDNGVNIQDINVKNIVIMSWDKISFIQALGRVRIDIHNPHNIKLYIPTMSLLSFQTLLKKQLEYKEKLIKDYREDKVKFNQKYDYEYKKLPDDIFIKQNGEWTINPIGEMRLILDMQFTKYMLDKFKDSKNKEFIYVKEQLSWIKQEHTFNAENLIKNVKDNEELNTLEDWLNLNKDKRLYKEDQDELSNLIIKELTTVGNNIDYRTKTLKPSTLEKIIREELELEYVVSKVKREDKTINGERVRKRYIVISKIK